MEDNVDQTQWVEFSEEYPLITPERRAKGDMLILKPCPECNGQPEMVSRCKHCRGKGRIADQDDGSTPIHDISYAQFQVRNLMNFLWEKNVLDDQHVHDGRMYEVWQTCFSAFLGYRNSPIYRGELSELRTTLARDGLTSGDFEKLIRSLALAYKQIIEFAIYTTSTEHLRWLALRNADCYRRSFDQLSAIMKALREQAEEHRKETACNDPQFR